MNPNINILFIIFIYDSSILAAGSSVKFNKGNNSSTPVIINISKYIQYNRFSIIICHDLIIGAYA